jgi:Fe-S oxidoreductase
VLRLRRYLFDPAARTLECASTRKLAALESGNPDVIASANIGCMMHLADGATVKVRHWIELLDSRMVGGPRSPA